MINHLSWRNNFTINTQVLLKGICRWRKFDNIVTTTWIIISISSTIIPLHNFQRHVNHITINNSFINVLVILFICSILLKIIIIQLLWQPRIWECLQSYTLPYLGWLTASFIFESQQRDNIVVQAWKINYIILISSMPGYNFRSDRWW